MKKNNMLEGHSRAYVIFGDIDIRAHSSVAAVLTVTARIGAIQDVWLSGEAGPVSCGGLRSGSEGLYKVEK